MTQTSHPAPAGTYHLVGDRAYDGTARFTLTLTDDVPIMPSTITVFRNVNWPTAWTALHKIFKHEYVESMMREVLP